MPSSAEHRAKYLDNRNHLDTGNNGGPLSTLNACWATTVAFYAALHLVDRLAACASYHPGNHTDRNRYVAGKHNKIWPAYNALYTASKIARYGTVNQFNLAFPGTTVQIELIDKRLVAIETYVNNTFVPPKSPEAGS